MHYNRNIQLSPFCHHMIRLEDIHVTHKFWHPTAVFTHNDDRRHPFPQSADILRDLASS